VGKGGKILVSRPNLFYQSFPYCQSREPAIIHAVIKNAFNRLH